MNSTSKNGSPTGDDVGSFEVRLETWTGNTEWTMRDVEDAKEARALELLEEGISCRDTAEEVKMGKSTVQRWAKARGVPAW
jgi:hypothetical protein